MKVSACLVTRGDVDMQPILESLPPEWEKIVWSNSGRVDTYTEHGLLHILGANDLSVYGRYAAIEYASHDLIYVQDDDVIVSDPQQITDAWILEKAFEQQSLPVDTVVCNMPQEFRPHYPDSGLVGFGAAFHRDAPARAFARMWDGLLQLRKLPFDALVGGRVQEVAADPAYWPESFLRRADNVFTVLTPRVLVDVPKMDCAYASDSNRMWRQSGHIGERDRMIELARQVRDARA